MKRSTLTLFGYLLLVFLSGVLVGVIGYRLYTLQSVSAKANPCSPEVYRSHYVEEMRSRLGLGGEQVRQLNAILDATRDRYRGFREKHKDELQAIQEEQVNQVRVILTDDQRAEYEKMRQERDRRRKESGH